MGKRSNCDKTSGVKKGPWLPEEDSKLVGYIKKHGHGSWTALPQLAGLNRCGKSCRLRWTNYLRPDIKRGLFSEHEEHTIIHLHSLLGNKWSAIAASLPGRTDNEIKNFWNTRLKKKLLRMGIDPVTHTPRVDPILLSNLPQYNFVNSAPAPSSFSQVQMARFQLLRDVMMGFMPPNNTLIPVAEVPTGSSQMPTGSSQMGSGPIADGVPFLFSEMGWEAYGPVLGDGFAEGVNATVDDSDTGALQCFYGMGGEETSSCGVSSLSCSSDSEIFDAWRQFKEERYPGHGGGWTEISN